MGGSIPVGNMGEGFFILSFIPSESDTDSTQFGADNSVPPIWTYSPAHWKTEHVSDRPRTIYLGPQSQEILQLYMRPGPLFLTQYFKPYQTNGFYREVVRACDRTEAERWFPNQIRHAAGTRFRKQFGVEITQTLLGHASVNTTEIYALQDSDAAMRAAMKFG